MNEILLLGALKNLVKQLVVWAYTGPRRPDEFTITVIGEHLQWSPTLSIGEWVDEVHAMRFNVTEIKLAELPEGNPDNVAVRDFGVFDAETNAAVFTQTFGVAPDLKPSVNLQQGKTYNIMLVDIDTAGNRSEPRILVHTATDVTPPRQPGEFETRVLSEFDV